jgi:hypothetical protein
MTWVIISAGTHWLLSNVKFLCLLRLCFLHTRQAWDAGKPDSDEVTSET